MNSHDAHFFEPAVRPARQAEGDHDQGPLVILAAALTAARRSILPLAVWLVLCFGAAAWYLHVTPPSFTATATAILDPKRPAAAMGDSTPNVQAPALDAAQAESQIQVIRSERLLSSVFSALNLADAKSLQAGPPGFLAMIKSAAASMFGKAEVPAVDKATRTAAAFDTFMGRVGARRVGQSYVIEVSYTSGDPDEARRLANAILSAYLGQQVSFKLAAAQNGAEYLQGRVNALSNEVKAATSGIAVGEVPSSLLPDADARIIGAALEPLARSAPKSGLVLSFAGAFGLLSGLFVVAVLNGLDRRIRSAKQLERAVSLPCLGVLPDVRRRKGLARRSNAEMFRLARSESEERFAAAVRDTRTSILLAFENKRGHAVGITSWEANVGRSLVAANLAQVIAMSGSFVTLVDANIHRRQGGLTDLVSPVAVGLADSLLDPSGVTLPTVVSIDDGLGLVPARSETEVPVFDAYLGAAVLPRLLETWRGHGDVVVDLPSLDIGGDARAAAARLDGIIVVVEANRTTSDEVERAVATLSRAGANVVGTVLNRYSA